MSTSDPAPSHSQIQCRIHTHLTIDRRKVTTAILNQLKVALTIHTNNQHIKEQSQTVHLYKSDGHLFHLPRGCTSLINNVAIKNRRTIHWDVDTLSRSYGARSLRDLPIKLRSYQQEAVDALVEGVQGWIKAPCGAGKTVIGAAALYKTGEPGIVLVHTHDLMNQWVAIFRSWNISVRTISGRSKNFSPLRPGEALVATVQTLHRLGDKADGILKSAGVIMLDEAHHAPATTFNEVIQKSPAKYRWGLTATPDREDGWGHVLNLVLGPQRWKISMGELVDAGFLMRPDVNALNSGVYLSHDDFMFRGRVNMTRAVNALCKNGSRHRLIMDLVKMLYDLDRIILLLVPRVEQATNIAATLQATGIVATSVTGKTSSVLREQRIRSVRRGMTRVLVATQLADEGLDVSNLDAVIVASTGKAAGRAVQRIGRVMRVHPDKKQPIVVDIADPMPFSGQWRSRSRAYLRELGVMVPRPESWDFVRRYIANNHS